ncbi:MAG TPA: CsgG/HfaB family protein, partial [Gemmatimonadales bacterium]|nr:CsgG/HfaB family protein [Gemmatimonadales bacterium]
ILAAAAPGACGRAPRPAAVTPADIPALESQARQDPGNAAVRLRLAAAYLAAGRCEPAVEHAGAGLRIAPDNVLGPLVIGACQEREARYDLAAATYGAFLDRYPRARGVAALRARRYQAVRQGAILAARQALAREVELAGQPPEPGTLAVLPVTIAGDTAFGALSRGLAELITTDLAVLRSIRLLERVHLGALAAEMRLAETGRVDPATAARMGRLLRAEGMVQGVATIRSERAPVRLELSVIAGDGTVRPGPQVAGPFRELLDLQKQLVLGLGPSLGIEITQAERERILRQGPRNLAAFLAYSQGLEALDRGDYGAAAARFREAVRADPHFAAAEQGRQTALAAPVVQQATEGTVVTVVEAVQAVVVPAEPGTAGATGSAALDVAPTLGDVVAQQTGGPVTGTDATIRQPTVETQGIVNLQGTSALIRIIFRRPP